MKKTLTMYFMTFLMVGLAFKSGPAFEAKLLPVASEQSISEEYRLNDLVCYTWKFRKNRDLPLEHLGFNIADNEGNVYDAETTDQETNNPLYFTPNKTRHPVGKEIVRYACTTLPNVKGPLTLQGKLVYKTWINLWQVTHLTPTIVVPKGD